MSPFRLAITEISADLTASVFRTSSPKRDNLPPCFLACSRATVVFPFYPTSNESHLRELWRRMQHLIPKRRCLPIYTASCTRRQQNLYNNHKSRSLHVLKKLHVSKMWHLLDAKVQRAWRCTSTPPCSLVASTGTSIHPLIYGATAPSGPWPPS